MSTKDAAFEKLTNMHQTSFLQIEICVTYTLIVVSRRSSCGSSSSRSSSSSRGSSSRSSSNSNSSSSSGSSRSSTSISLIRKNCLTKPYLSNFYTCL